MDVLVKAFVEKQRMLLDLEYAAQMETQAEYLTKLTKQQLQKRGVALLNLRESSRFTGLGGKLVVEYVGGYENQLPTHQIKVGDVVKVEKGSSGKAASEITGTVSSVKTGSVSVAFKDEYPEDWSDGLRLIKLANDVAFKRLRYALDKLEELPKKGSHNALLQLIFDMRCKPIVSDSFFKVGDYKFYKDTLNDIQKEIVVRTISRSPCALIHGPPGTGKSETLVEIIKQLVRPTVPDVKPKRVLVCAPSNLAVDNLVERLGTDPRLSLLRLGHPARMLDTVLHHSLDYKLVHGDSGKLVSDIRKEIDAFVRKIPQAKGQERREIYGALKDLRKDLKVREAKSLDELFRSTQIVLCTLNMAGSKQLNGHHFDVALIDEASQAMEAECWLPMILADQVIFAGDHQQLPPTVTSEEAAAKGLAETLFGKLIKSRGPSISSMLKIQYRMHEDIMNWASEAMYDGLLVADPSVAKHRLKDIAANITVDDPMLMIDTAGSEMFEGVTEDTDVESKFNEGEAKIAIEHAKQLIESGLSPSDCAIISPYNGQVDLLKTLLEAEKCLKGLEIGTVDSFQGREKEAIIISFVRSNDDGIIGFLSDIRRTNVAVTRARRHVCLIGDSDTLNRHPFYKNLIGYVDKHGVVDYPVI